MSDKAIIEGIQDVLLAMTDKLVERLTKIEKRLDILEGSVQELQEETMSDEEIVKNVVSLTYNNNIRLQSVVCKKDNTGYDGVFITFFVIDKNKQNIGKELYEYKKLFTDRLFKVGIKAFPYIDFKSE